MESKHKIPEAMGLITAIVFLMASLIIMGLLEIEKDKLLLFLSGLL